MTEINKVEETNVLEMRELNSSDIFKMTAIIGKLDIKDDLISVFRGESGASEDIEGRGMEIMAGLVQSMMVNLPKIEKDLNSFLADLTGLKLKDIQALSMTEYVQLLIQFSKKEELLDFFKSLSSLMK